MARRSLSTSYAEVVNSNGHGLSVPVQTSGLHEKAGYAPDRLDPVVQTLVKNAEDGADLLQRYTPMLDALMGELQVHVKRLIDPDTVRSAPDGTMIEPPNLGEILKIATQVSMIMERLNKMTMNAVKAKDDASRLRSFLAGDQDRGDLDHLSENQLRKLVSDAASGWVKPEDSDGG